MLAIIIVYAFGGLNPARFTATARYQLSKSASNPNGEYFAKGIVSVLKVLSAIPLQQFPAMAIGMPACFVYDLINATAGNPARL